jgi:hypothetical protein
MSLKFPFKFKHRLADNVFFAEKENVDTVKVSWDTDRVISSRKYEMSLVEYFVDCGGWVIIEEPSPLVEITQDEYTNLIEEINLLQELLAEANNRIVELEAKSKFKPIKDMTIRDWDLATLENHKFKTRDGNEIRIVTVDNGGSIWSVGTTYGWHRVDGTFHPEDDVAEDIIERIS